MVLRSSLVLAALPVLVGATASAQSPAEAPISTDRPGVLFAPTLVPPGRLQVESSVPGFSIFDDADAEVRTWSLPVALRYGYSE